jgi:transcriptional regulator with XRE-family HTH domain
MRGFIRGQQLAAGRALINLTQKELASAAGLHPNSIRYLERQNRITTGFSRERFEQAMREGKLFTTMMPLAFG